jgi:hypothetical protein
MVTPSALNSGFCRFEFESFIEREKELGRNDLVFPILYISVPELEATSETADPVISIVKDRQYEDWRPIRYLDVNSPDVRRTVGQFCSIISRKLRAPWISPEERRQIEEQRRVEEQRRIQEVETKRQVEEEEGRRAAEAKRRAEQEQREREEEAKRQVQEERARKKRQVQEERARKEAERIDQKRRREQEEQERRERKEKESTVVANVPEADSQTHKNVSSEPSWMQMIGTFIGIVFILGIVVGIIAWTEISLHPQYYFRR